VFGLGNLSLTDVKRNVVMCVSVELRNVVTVPVYTLSVIAALFAAFLLAGYRTNAARFVQLQYGYDYQHAWFYTDGKSTSALLHPRITKKLSYC